MKKISKKEVTSQQLSQQIGDLAKALVKTKEGLTGQISDLAGAVAKGFENTATKFEVTFLGERLDRVQERLRVVETKVDKALYSEISHHEARLRRLEEKTGITN